MPDAGSFRRSVKAIAARAFQAQCRAGHRLHTPQGGIRLGDFVKGGHTMPDASCSPLEHRKAEVAGSVVLKVLRILPDSASAEMLRELIDMVVVDPDDRALFEFLGNRR